MLMSFVVNQVMLIKPGKSVGHFFINKTTLKEVKSEYGKGRIQELKWYAPYCGMEYPYYKLVYADKGISFTFYKRTDKGEHRFETIELIESFGAETESHIAAGYSTRSDVYLAYGQLSVNDNSKYVAYKKLGISFEFANSENHLTDTITTIFIYEPSE
ncbi:MAG: hypothetical protein DRI84_02170 [Bacteroidetes bacterium]|nr:MAG: hypothetical protein DRI84_02170 [Bacteroidota bacterium]